ncbi:HicB family toxin-antitoxin system [Nocardioides marmoriginsengisoli]|uniref:HicB family toxin-antitoxin system n=1 Tax=Nocardioides marmoriginsengisoli TaxID=661483 RepID=A0A3N0CB54_9ACTN|nr:HicB family toxin-antitoxin system [Nocardioides marmoriginsengisoli]RNL60471.1 HicB family toxin-antitoxin system [Nocardioides marmoriginsengisoli]
MRTFEVKVRRDGKWWMIEIPEIDGLTQARRLSDVEDMARSYIAVDQDLVPSQIQLMNPQVEVEGSDLAATMAEILNLRAEAKEAEERAAALMVRTAKALAKADVPLRDIGSVLAVSHQRVHQLLSAEAKR